MNPSNLKYKLFKSGTLRITCKGSRHMAWCGDKWHPTKKEEIEECLHNFCQRCEIKDCSNKVDCKETLRK